MMLTRILVIWFFISVLVIQHTSGQRILLLNKPGSFRNFKYSPGDYISIKTTWSKNKIEGQIHRITDTLIVVNYINEIYYENITMVYRPRRMVELGSILFMAAGAGYFVLDAFNHAINNQSPIFDKTTALISGGLVVAGGLMQTYKNRKFRIGKKWKLQVLDFSIDYDAFSKEEPENP